MSSTTPPPAEPAGASPHAGRDSAAPPGYGTVTPWIISPDTARLIDFAKAAFGAQELARVPGPDRKSIGHAEVRIGDSAVMMFDARDGWPHTPAFLRLYVPDAGTSYQRALAAGGRLGGRDRCRDRARHPAARGGRCPGDRGRA